MEPAPASPTPLQAAFAPAAQVVASAPPLRSERSDVFTIGDGGEVVVTLPAVLTQDAYDDLKDWLDLIGRKAKRRIVAGSGPAGSAAREGETH
jgi:hypothetical protein